MNDIESGRDSRRRKKTMLRKRNHSGTYIYSYGLGSTSSLIARSQQGATRQTKVKKMKEEKEKMIVRIRDNIVTFLLCYVTGMMAVTCSCVNSLHYNESPWSVRWINRGAVSKYHIQKSIQNQTFIQEISHIFGFFPFRVQPLFSSSPYAFRKFDISSWVIIGLFFLFNNMLGVVLSNSDEAEVKNILMKINYIAMKHKTHKLSRDKAV